MSSFNGGCRQMHRRNCGGSDWRCRRETATVQELYDALLRDHTEPRVPLEVTEVRLMSLHRVKA